MVERRRIIKPKRKSPCELCEDELGKEGSFYNRETKKCDCKREEGYLLDKPNSRCIKCSGNGAFIKFGKCHCGAGSVFKNENELSNCVCRNETEWNGKLCEPLCDEEEHLQLKNGLCVCKEGFLESTDEGCVPCSGPTSHLVDGFCACGENHLLDESKCIECGGLGAFVVDHQCSCELQHYRLSPSGKVCHCPSDFVLTPTGSCLPCAAGLVSNNTCTCPADHLYHSQSVSCIKCISGTLSDEGNCTCPEKHELLESEARCVKCFGDGSSLDQLGGHCTCEGSSLLSFSGQCIKCSGPGASIKEGTENCTCLNGILNSESECVTCNGPGSYLTKKGKCKCKKKSKLSADGTCVPCYGEGKLLDGVNCICDTGFIQSENGDCIRCEGEGSFLKGDKCSCDHDFVLSENKCVKCHGAGSFLSASGDCSCHEGFILSDDKSSCARCEGPGAFIQDNRCACDPELSILNFQKIACISCFGPGADLDKDNNCVCGDLHSFPDREKGCSCESGYQRNSEGNCIACEGTLTETNECMCPDGTLLTSSGACITCPPGSTVNVNYSARMGTAGEICVCEEGTQLSQDASQCLPCTGPGSSLDENGVCKCSGSFYMKEPGVCAICVGGIQNSTASECICPEGSLTYAEEICIPCKGPTSSMSLFGSCMCDDDSALFDDETSSCYCRAYFLEAKLTPTCISCFGDGAYLNELDECQCRNGSQLYPGGLCDFPEIRREPIILETTQEMTTAAAPLESDVSLIIIPWILMLLLILILLQFCWLYCKRNIVTKIPIEENIANEPELDELIAPKSTAPVERPPRRVSTPVVIPPTPEPRNQFSTAGTSTDVEYKPISRDQEMQTSTRSLASISSQQSSSSSWTMGNTPVVPHAVNELAQQRERDPITPPQVAVNIVGANDGIVNWDYQRDVAYYIVSCIKLFDQDKDEKMFKLSPEETQTLIPALHADSEYQILVTAFDYDNKYKCSEHVRVFTKGTPPGPPQRITFDNIDDQSIHVSWGEPPDIDTRITKYLLMYYPSNNQAQKQVLPLPGNQRTISINKLKKSEEYTFEIRAETRWGLGDVQTSTVTIDQMKNSDRNSIFFAESISDLTRHISAEELDEKAQQRTKSEHRQKTNESISGKDLTILAQSQADSSGQHNQTASKTIAKVTLTTETVIGRVAQNSSQHNNQSIEEIQMYRKLETDGDEDILQTLGPQAVDIMNKKNAEEHKEEVLFPVEVNSSYELDSEITDVLRVQLRNQYQPLYDDTEAYPSSLDDEPVSTLSSEQASHFQQLAGRGGEPADDSSEAYVSEYQSEADESGSFHFENLIHSEATERQSLLLEERMDSRIRQSSNSSELQESANQSQLSVATCIEKGEATLLSTTSKQSRSQADLETVYRSNAFSTSESAEQKATFRKSTTEVYDSFKQEQKLNIYDNIASANIMESIGSISVQSDEKEKDEGTHWTYSL